MDDQALSMEAFLTSLTEEQVNTCESDEKQLAEIFDSGWSDATAVQFHRAMLHARHVGVNVTVEGVFEMAFRLGLAFLGDEGVLARLKQEREDDVIVYGLQSKDAGRSRTACIVSPDVAALAKLRQGKKPRKRGVRGV
ncbi:MAG: hypothetical protein P4M01_10110 [Acidobacteriota bacterium]|nr:hypothetical protein [Acidobacteriota bacterium]